LITAVAMLCGLLGLAAFVAFHHWQGLGLIAIGSYVCWTHGRKALANAPRDYAPDRLPEKLLA
jgi:hypothetical protein